MTQNISYEDFKNNDGELFHLKGHELYLRLTSVSSRKVSGPWESFSLLFKAEGDFGLEQGTFLLEHDALGELDIFLVPIRQSFDEGAEEDTSVTLYESVFNRQIDSAE